MTPVGYLHPLFFDEILDEVFRYVFWPAEMTVEAGSCQQPIVNHKDVCNIRLVCKKWKDVGTRLYCKYRMPLRLRGDSIVSSKFSYPNEVTSFLQTMKASSFIPAISFQFDHELFESNCDKRRTANQDIFFQFHQLCGPTVIRLEIKLENMCSFKLSKYQKIQLPSLISLTFKIRWIQHHGSRHTELVTSFLQGAVNLQEFVLSISTAGFDNDLLFCENLLAGAFLNVPSCIKILQVSNVTVCGLVDGPFSTLMAKKNKLEKLCFTWSDSLRSDELEKFLDSQVDTLKHLKLGCNGTSKHLLDQVITMPSLTKLVSLSLHYVGGPLPSFTTAFPQLRDLDVEHWPRTKKKDCFQFLEPVCSTNSKMPPLEKINLPGFTTAEVVKNIGITCLYLKSLTYTPHFGALFSELEPVALSIFQHCLNLQNLWIAFHPPMWEDEVSRVKNMDCLLSGLSEQICAQLKVKGRQPIKNVQKILPKLQINPSLLNLTKLRRLKIVNKSVRSFPVVTRLTTELVFYQMKSLTHLDVGPDGYDKNLSMKMRRSLDQKFRTIEENEMI